MKLKTACKSFNKFISFFMLFFFIQIINSDWNFTFNYDMGKKIILSFLTTVIFLLVTHLIEKRLNNERPND